ncbi:8-oxo-dGTP pyrophosphatase MutT (NUDIX family) [Planomicrobium stackebrandtii]|uniref:8-oxo-dGTP pyrophosphatase MutT (NUDIX family) n=1 Tax=Planomicrobium stackebrandtii TaxID=253160 RepID=A0ABU0H022_9BACL|nr:NUDIX domain-containing protein [Planomicrobium stackebrandtii]MDQ0430150.1 8-oxo-dGTP pyrophosphatase MutT (NUDIX family) [Planomicrobium stackebrandtii]
MEIWDLFDDERKLLGKQHMRGQAMTPGEYHIVVEIFTFNRDGKLLVTQRDGAKTYPLLWECTGGSVTARETSLVGAVRELEEETGLVADPKDLQLIGSLKKDVYFLDSYMWKSPKQLELTDLNLQDGEVCGAKFVTLAEWEEMNSDQLVVPKVWERYKLYNNCISKKAKTLNIN